MKKLLFILIYLLTFYYVFAQDFTQNNINYSIIGSNEVSIERSPNAFGNLILESTVVNNNQTYTVVSVNDYVFSNCQYLTSITLPNSITTIGSFAFSQCQSLNFVILPNLLSSIQNSIFSDCVNLTLVTIPDSVTSIGVGAFYNCQSLSSINIPNSVTSIGGSAFYGCQSLVSVVIPNSVTSIGSAAFRQCYNLTSITLPNSITNIAEFTFYYCQSLPLILIPESVINIENFAFSGCSSLTSVVCDIINPLVINSSVFYGVNYSNCSLTIPSGSYNVYINAPIWQLFNPINGIPNLNTTNFSLKEKVQFYPNPTKNELFIDVKNLSNAKLDVFYSNGRVLFCQPLNDITTINTSSLTSGMYFFKITTDEGVITKKIIKN